MTSPLTIFAIYTSENKEVLQQILRRLKPLEEANKLSIWDDNPILMGQPWKPKNESQLEQTDIFLLLLSNSFMHSEFVQQLEFKMVIDRYKAGDSNVIPVILEECPWNVDFEADEYTFNFKELNVLPENGKAIKNWESSKKAYKNVAASIKAAIGSLVGDDALDEGKKESESKILPRKAEEQTAIHFAEEKETKLEKINAEDIESKKIAEENKLQRELEAKKRLEKEKRLKEDSEAKIREEKERKLREAAAKKAEEQKEIERQALIKKQNEEKKIKAEAEAKRLAARESKLAEENRRKIADKTNKEIEEIEQEIGFGLNRRLIIGIAVAFLTILGIWWFSNSSDEPSTIISDTETREVEEPVVLEKTEKTPIEKEEPINELTLGEFYQGGMIFSIDSENKNGKIVQIEDAGPMTWKNAMQIHEQLGEGWRVPTLEELKVVRKTVGQGATNQAEFSNGLYWSATDYDQYQARLLRFRDGNTSYHYNKEAEHRQYRVRAIRNFSR